MAVPTFAIRKQVALQTPAGEPVDLKALTIDETAIEMGDVRSPAPRHPSMGLSPEGLAAIMLERETSDPSRYWELLDDVHEKEPQLRGVVAQRRLALAQLPTTVDPASDDTEHVKHADFVRQMLGQDEMTASKFDLSDGLWKGVAFGMIDWETSERQWMPRGIKFTATNWFRFDRVDLTTPMMLDRTGIPQPLTPYKWVMHRPRLNSGLPVRDGLGGMGAWAWMLKNFSLKSWTIFLNKCGMPLRLGTYPAGTDPRLVTRFLNSLRNMGFDATAVVPEGFNVEFPKTDGGGGGDEAYNKFCTYIDEQMAKAVLGQTGTSDASKGGYAVGKVHEGVKDAICIYDGLMLAMALSRQLVRPAIDLNFGPQSVYPSVKIGLGDMRNLQLVLQQLPYFVDRGLPVEASQIYPLFGLTEPATDAKLLVPVAKPGPIPGTEPPPSQEDRAGLSGGGSAREAKLSAEDDPAPTDSFDEATASILQRLGWKPELGDLPRLIAACTTPEEVRSVLKAHVGKFGEEKLAALLSEARFVSNLSGRVSPSDG